MGLEKINFYRKLKGMSIDDLAKLSGVPKSTLSKITAGITKNPNLDTVKAITTALGITLDDLDDSFQNSYLNTTNNDFDFYVEKQIQLLGYEIIFDEKDTSLWLKGKEGVFEITKIQLDNLSKSLKTYLDFKIQEVMARSRKIEKQGGYNKPHIIPDAAHEIEGASDEDKIHDNSIMDDDDF